MEKLVEWTVLAGETEVLIENVPDATYQTQANPGRRGGKPASNRFSYGAAYKMSFAPIFHYLELSRNELNILQQRT
jgi:hypothetical protein